LSYRLNKEPEVQYSDSEKRLFSLLGAKARNTLELTDAFYTGEREAPFTARQTIVSYMSSLSKKIEHNKEPFQLVKSPRRGPAPIEYRIVPRVSTKALA
jgi:hypothetical protein